MRTPPVRPVAIALALLAAWAATTIAHAQTFPSKPVRMVVPFPAGGGLDTTARAFGLKLNDYWGQTVVIENRPGASGMIGAESVVRSPKDGYVLLVCSPAEVALNPALYAKMTYDPFKDLAPISLAATYPNIVVVHASVPVKTVKELIALSKKTPGGLPFGSSGTGSTQHLAGEWLNFNAGFNLLHVPYKGAAPATTDLVGGQIPTAILGLAPVIPHIKSGRLRGIAVTAAQRAGTIPDVPTMNESGIKFESTQWFGFLAPAGTPADVIAKIQADVKRAAADAGVRDRLSPLGGDPLANTPEEFAAFIRAENVKYAKVIKDAGIKAE
jgi:tripartite-type tricarboxylate transporter receptor subunit TctC